jgi:hypothetical protein
VNLRSSYEPGLEGWDAGLEPNWAITQAGNLNETTIMRKLQHLRTSARSLPPWKPSTRTDRLHSTTQRVRRHYPERSPG